MPGRKKLARVAVVAGALLIGAAATAYAAVRANAAPEFSSTLVALHSERCLTAPAANGGGMRQAACTGAADQRFEFKLRTGDAYEIRNAATKSCVDIRGAGFRNGVPVTQWADCHGRPNQLFTLRPVEGRTNTFMVVARHSGRCLDVLAGAQDDAAVLQWACGDPQTAGNQTWRIDGASGATTGPTASAEATPPSPDGSSLATTPPAATPSAAPSATPGATPGGGGSGSGGSSGDDVVANPAWGKELPPAGAKLSRAYTLIQGAKEKGYQPRSGECSTEIHARYWTYGPDGKVYPTWHPPKDASGCTFGHEHGDDPRTAQLFAKTGFFAFGYTNEQLAPSNPASQRDEDHVGHKVQAGNDTEVRQGDTEGTSTSGPVTMVCDTLMKFHQGTHSPDALVNNLHELLYNARCAYKDNGAVIETRFAALMPLGHPGGFNASEECAGNRTTEHRNVGTPVPADSPDSNIPGRFIPDATCAAAVIAGTKDMFRMSEVWVTGVFARSGKLQQFQIFPFFVVLNPSRYFDPALPNKIGRHLDLCYQGAKGFQCDQVRRISGKLAFDDPRSPFNGASRLFSPGTFIVQNTGPTTLYTDVFGRRFSTTEFPGSIKQYIAGNHAGDRTQGSIPGTFKNYAGNASDKIHAPN
jgi:hypothetical protein